MSSGFVIAALAAASLVGQDGSVAQCVTPELPAQQRFTSPVLPVVPDCVDLVAQKADCEADVLSAYSASVEAYNAANAEHVAKINAYIAQLRTYRQAATDYAMCESQANSVNSEAPPIVGE